MRNGLFAEAVAEDGLIPYRKNLLTLLSDACRSRSKRYANLADYPLQKKGEPAMEPVHLSD
jgi:hypothetical protein